MRVPASGGDWVGSATYDTGRRSRRAGMKRLLYWLYERRLLRQIRAGEAPQHVGIILDGNRRYARKHRLADPCEAYNIGAEKLDPGAVRLDALGEAV